MTVCLDCHQELHLEIQMADCDACHLGPHDVAASLTCNDCHTSTEVWADVDLGIHPVKFQASMARQPASSATSIPTLRG